MSNISRPTYTSHVDEMGLTAASSLEAQHAPQKSAGKFFGISVEAANSEQGDSRTAVAVRIEANQKNKTSPAEETDINESYWREIPTSFSSDEERFLKLMDQIQGKGLWAEKLNEETGEFDRSDKPIPFPAHEFLKLFTQIDILNPKLVTSHSFEEMTGALEFSFGCLKNDLRKTIADLSQQIEIAAKDQPPSEDNSKCWRLEEYQNQLEELLTTLEVYSDINNFDDPVRADLNNFLLKSEQAAAMFTLGKHDDMEQAEALSLNARASLASALEMMKEGTSRPHIIHYYKTAQQLSNQSLEALKKNKRGEFYDTYFKGCTFEAIAREMASENRQDIINDFQETTKILAQALAAHNQGRSKLANHLSHQGVNLLWKTSEASKKNRLEIVNGFQQAAEIFTQALVAHNRGNYKDKQANYISKQGLSLLKKTVEASKKNRQDIINSYQKANEIFAQTLVAHNQGDSVRAALLDKQGYALFRKAAEASQKNRQDIINSYQKANEIFAQALVSLDQSDSIRADLLKKQGLDLLQKTEEISR